MNVPDVVGGTVAALTAAVPLAGGWHHDAAPMGTPYPLGIVELSDDEAGGEFGGGVGLWRATVWVRVVGEGNARIALRQMREQAIAGVSSGWTDGAEWRLVDVWPVGLTESADTDDQTQRWQHVGVFLELVLEPVGG